MDTTASGAEIVVLFFCGFAMGKDMRCATTWPPLHYAFIRGQFQFEGRRPVDPDLPYV
ncbi:hypothetical protein [Agrobacterium tumefaciens]|uniref:hypothetical protein n=1 Tax=Agrobacterium tumefaciens TaxID=358 RepID=UPI001BA9B203|nr:hypothetical protein [Agrobacterium tumefaciens]